MPRHISVLCHSPRGRNEKILRCGAHTYDTQVMMGRTCCARENSLRWAPCTEVLGPSCWGFPSLECSLPEVGFTCTAFSFRVISWGGLKPLTAPRSSTFRMNVDSSMQSRSAGAQQALASANFRMSPEEGAVTPWQPQERGGTEGRELQGMLVFTEMSNLLVWVDLPRRGSTAQTLRAGSRGKLESHFRHFLLITKSGKCQTFGRPHACT